MALPRDCQTEAEGASSILPQEATVPATSGGELLCGWNHDDNLKPDRRSTTTTVRTSASASITNDSKHRDSELLCGWKHSPETQKPTLQSPKVDDNPTPSRTGHQSSTTSLPEAPLLCEWNHSKPMAKPSARTRRNSLVKEGKANSVPDLFSDFMDDDESEQGGGFLARVGTSMRNLFEQQPSEEESPKPVAFRGRPQLQRGLQSERIDRKKLLRKAHSLTWNAKDESDDEEEDGVVTYLGKQYSARDLFERCNNSRSSTRTMYSHNDSNATLSSFGDLDSDDDDDDDDDESEAEDRSGLGRFLVRGLSSLKLGAPEEGNNIQSLNQSAHQTRRPKLPPRSKSYGGSDYGRERSMSPLRPKGANRTRSRTPPRRTKSALSSAPMSNDDHLGKLQVDPNDVLSITENPQDFAALKETLKRNKAITNGLLQQGFHVFVHQQKQAKQERQRREWLKARSRERARSKERLSPRKESGSPNRIQRPTPSRERRVSPPAMSA